MPVNPINVQYSLINGVRFGNVEPCNSPNNLCDISASLADSRIDSFDGHLTANSPAVNAGTTSGAPDDDLEGNPRDANPDIGAYER